MARPTVLRVVGAILLVAAATVGAADESPVHAFTIVSQRAPRVLDAGAEVQVPIELRNDGSLTWRPSDRVRLAYHWRDDDGAVAVWDGERSELPGEVPPGATVAVVARLRAPVRPGVYTLQWDMVHEFVCWFAEQDRTPEPRRKVVVRAAVPETGFEVVAQDTPRWMVAGRRLEVPLKVRNTGRWTWPGDGSVRIAAHWLRPDGSVAVWDGLRTRIAAPVPPGGEVEMPARLQVPSGLGRWRLEWDMVDEGVCWFSKVDPRSGLELKITVLPEPADLRVLAAVTFLLALIAVSAASARRLPGWFVAVLSVADLAWLAATLTVAQNTVLREAGRTLVPGAWPLAGAAVAILVLPLVLLPRRVRPWVAWGVGLTVSLLLAADVLYLRYFGDLLSLAAAAGAGQTGQVLDSAVALARPHDVWLLVHLLPGLVLVGAVAALAKRSGRRPVLVAAFVLGLAVVPGARAVVGSLETGYGFASQVFSSLTSARHVGVLGYHLADVVRTVDRRVRAGHLSEQQYRDVVEWFRSTAPRRAGTGPLFGVARGANLVMVQVESMQAFVVGLEVDGQPVTPWLDAHRAEWIEVPRMTDQTAQGRSSDSELATQASLLPATAGAAAFLYSGDHFTGIAGILAGAGYTTVSAVAFEGTFWNRRRMHPAYGYATSLFAPDFGPGERIGWGLNDVDFLAQMAARLERLEPPVCAYLITLSLHHPFANFPDDRKVLHLGGLEGTPLGNYLHTMRLLDHAVGSFVDGLDARGLGGDTIVVLWGDHDAGFGVDPQVAALAGIRSDTLGWELADAVPLMIRVPGLPGRVVDRPAGHVDVAPTVLALLGIDPAGYAFVGRNLLGTPGSGPVLAEHDAWSDGKLLFLPRGGDLDDGVCWSIADRKRVNESACAASQSAAANERRVSNAVLDHDLQQRLHRELERPGH